MRQLSAARAFFAVWQLRTENERRMKREEGQAAACAVEAEAIINQGGNPYVVFRQREVRMGTPSVPCEYPVSTL